MRSQSKCTQHCISHTHTIRGKVHLWKMTVGKVSSRHVHTTHIVVIFAFRSVHITNAAILALPSLSSEKNTSEEPRFLFFTIFRCCGIEMCSCSLLWCCFVYGSVCHCTINAVSAYIYIAHIILTFLCSMFRNGISFGAHSEWAFFAFAAGFLLFRFCDRALYAICRKNVVCAWEWERENVHVTQANKMI